MNESTAAAAAAELDDDPVPEMVHVRHAPQVRMELLKTYNAMPLTIARGEGCHVWDTTGRRYLDMYAGHAVASTGHAHPRVAAAIAEQAHRLIFYSNVAGLELRERAARRLLSYIASPGGIAAVLFANSGAEAIENALKMAVLQTGRRKLVAFEGGFHGRTLLATNVTGTARYRQQAPYQLDDVTIVPFGDTDAVRAAVDGETAAVLVEPVQSMAGCRMADPGFYAALREITSDAGAYLVYDEVQTGIGRTGRMFFAGRHRVTPDIVCLAKGIASGVPLSAVLVTEAIADRVEYGQFGATFGAGPLAMAALDATLAVIEDEGLLARVATVGDALARTLAATPGVAAVQGLGFLLGVRTVVPAAALQARLLERGVIVGTSDDPAVIRLLPPLVLTAADVAQFVDILTDALGGER